MPLITYAQQAGIFGSADLDLLSRAYSQAAFLTNDEEERANCARAVIALFRSGVRDEAALVSMAAEQIDRLSSKTDKDGSTRPS